MCVAIGKGNFVLALAGKLQGEHVASGNVTAKNGSAVFSGNLK
jgi:hypothetical protein